MTLPISRLSHAALALAAVGLVPLLAACDRGAASVPTKLERPVQVQRVVFANANPPRDFVGVVRARHETDLGFRVAGKILVRSVNMGDVVHAGDVIARLDPLDLNLQVESAQAELTAATSNLADAAAEEARYAKLITSASIPAADYDHKKAAKAEAEGRLERARRALDLARNQLDYTELKVDADGVIIATPAEGSAGGIAGELARRSPRVRRHGLPVGQPRPPLQSAATRTLAASRRQHPHLCGAFHHREP
jgi:multidrug efflux pump subunit AcrA (membrane-fusion protein)